MTLLLIIGTILVALALLVASSYLGARRCYGELLGDRTTVRQRMCLHPQESRQQQCGECGVSLLTSRQMLDAATRRDRRW